MVELKKRIWNPKLNFTIPEVDVAAFPIAAPLPAEGMEWVSRRWTVCQILREIFHALDTFPLDPECQAKVNILKLKCRIAATMTKVMILDISRREPKWGKFRWPWRDAAEYHRSTYGEGEATE